jgi:hypothetical protein
MSGQFRYVDSQLGARYILAFYANPALGKRLRDPWSIGRYLGAYRMGSGQTLTRRTEPSGRIQ